MNATLSGRTAAFDPGLRKIDINEEVDGIKWELLKPDDLLGLILHIYISSIDSTNDRPLGQDCAGLTAGQVCSDLLLISHWTGSAIPDLFPSVLHNTRTNSVTRSDCLGSQNSQNSRNSRKSEHSYLSRPCCAVPGLFCSQFGIELQIMFPGRPDAPCQSYAARL